MESLIYFIWAILGISFLVFIHELGHFFAAKYFGMRVEAFSVGFGPSIWQWESKGVLWKIGLIPFGGYVKIAGMDNEDPDPEDKSSFDSKSPWQRLVVAFAGPLANLLLAYVAFTLIWSYGGMEKPFSYFSKVIGWVQKESLQKEIHPGDRLLSINGNPYKEYKDLMMSDLLPSGKSLSFTIDQVNYETGANKEIDFHYDFKAPGERFSLVESFIPSDVLFFGIDGNELPAGAPLAASGIQKGERLLWADGKIVFSQKQLSYLLNQPTNLLTVKRGSDLLILRVMRYRLADLQLSASERYDFHDIAFMAGLDRKIKDLFFFPYELEKMRVEKKISTLPGTSQGLFLDELLPGDLILAIDGQKIHHEHELLALCQNKKLALVIQKISNRSVSSEMGDQFFFGSGVNWKELFSLVETLGAPKKEAGDLRLIEGISLLSQAEWQKKVHPNGSFLLPLQKQEAEKKVMGASFFSALVRYNPSPNTSMKELVAGTTATFAALFQGNAGAKNLGGPIAIISMTKESFKSGFLEGIYWMAFISFNLAVFNLLPIPVLDGGLICFALWEIITRKPIPQRVRARIFAPFMLLVLLLFVYITINDISKIFVK